MQIHALTHSLTHTSLDLNEAREDGVLRWQWQQLDHTQIICPLLQTDNHTNTSSLNFTGPMLFLTPNQRCQSSEGTGAHGRKNATTETRLGTKAPKLSCVTFALLKCDWCTDFGTCNARTSCFARRSQPWVMNYTPSASKITDWYQWGLFRSHLVGPHCMHNIQGGPKKWGHRLMATILSKLDRLKKNSLKDSLVNL